MLVNVPSSFYLDPNIKVQAISGNYMSLYDFTTKFYPSLKDTIIDQYGNQTIRGFLDKYAQKEMISADTQFFGMTGRRRKLLESVTRAGDVFTYAAHTIRPNENFMVIDKAGKKVITVSACRTITMLECSPLKLMMVLTGPLGLAG